MSQEGVRWAERARRRTPRGWAIFCLQAALLTAAVFCITVLIVS